MRTARRIILAAMAAALSASPAFALKRGDWVLAQFQGGRYWFPAVVQSVGGGMVALLYDDGDRESRPANQVRAYDWQVGTRVECNWLGRGDWYSGTITRLSSTALSIDYDDGDKENTTTGMCRSR